MRISVIVVCFVGASQTRPRETVERYKVKGQLEARSCSRSCMFWARLDVGADLHLPERCTISHRSCIISHLRSNELGALRVSILHVSGQHRGSSFEQDILHKVMRLEIRRERQYRSTERQSNAATAHRNS